MKKSKSLKRAIRRDNRYIRNFNRDLQEDIFKGRFYIKMLSREVRNFDDNSGFYFWYHLQVIDRENPEATKDLWLDRYEIYDGPFDGLRGLYKAVNETIVESDFWQKYREKGE